MTIERRYWDSDCFLGHICGEPGKAPLCAAVLNEAEHGKILIVTSALTIAEVLNLRHAKPIPKAERDKVTAFFKNPYIHVRNVTRRVAEIGRDLVWDLGVAPKDAIHVATALDARLDLMNTFDGDPLKKSGQIGSPPLVICHPHGPPQGGLELNNPNARKS